jgi:hypothetical protein
MNNFYKNYLINFLILFLLIFQAIIYFLNIKTSSQYTNYKTITVENFSSIFLSKSGLTKIGSEKLNKTDEKNIFLQGNSYLENNDYKIYGYDIYINLVDEVSQSEHFVKAINSMGTLEAQGFENKDSESKIYFKGEVIFKSHD